jgi:predicted dehydrogenase
MSERQSVDCIDPHPGEHDDVRVAVVGLGLIGRQRLHALQRIAGARLVASVDPIASPKPSETEVPHYRSLAELSVDDYDCAVVAVPHDVAVDVARQLLHAGRPILIEKPLGVSGADARDLEALAADLARPSFVGYNYRYLPFPRSRSCCGARTLAIWAGCATSTCSLDTAVTPSQGRVGSWTRSVRVGECCSILLLRLTPDAQCTSIQATRGFWSTGIEEDVVASFRDECTISSVRASHIRWVNTFRVELFGEDGYAIAEGRGGNYGPMTLRVGRRWAWTAPGAASQRESEEMWNFGERNDSLHDELTDVIARWGGAAPSRAQPRPATMSEAREITELCERLYAKIT